jgi:hypothetical protein
LDQKDRFRMNDLVKSDPQAAMPALSVQQAVERFNAVVEFVQTILREGVDYGTIPGTGKATLLKPGAEKLTTFFGLIKRFQLLDRVEDWSGADHDGERFFYYLYRCQLLRGDTVVAEADGSCNSWETKYRYRTADRLCPQCGKATIIKGREEYGGGWLCFVKKGGCGAKFLTGDPSIEGQVTGRVLNADIADQVNTIQKMAQKRALVAATLLAVNASEFFTQDLEDLYVDASFTVEPAMGRQELLATLREARDQLRMAGQVVRPLTQKQVERMSDAELREELARTRRQLEDGSAGMAAAKAA